MPFSSSLELNHFIFQSPLLQKEEIWKLVGTTAIEILWDASFFYSFDQL